MSITSRIFLPDRSIADLEKTKVNKQTELTEKSIRDRLVSYERNVIISASLRKSAVLIPIVRSDLGLQLLFTKRTDSVEHHKGQVSFPGGAVDEGDATIVETALREASEEIGLERAAVSVLGAMDDLQTPSGFVVTPIIGYIDQLPPLRMNAEEVAEVILIPLEKFFDSSLRHSEFRERNGLKIEVFFYNVWREPVWGATAFFVKRLVDVLQSR